jgi:hypothetical protein
MHQGLIDLKNEVEKDLLNIKNIWINDTLKTFVSKSPIPGRAPFSRGPFINTIILKYDSDRESFNFARTKKIAYEIKYPYTDISITSLIYYNENIETLGWNDTPPYRPFSKTLKISKSLINNLCDSINKKIKKRK